MQKTLLPESKLIELNTDMERLEKENFGISDMLNSKNHKKAEVDRILLQLPQHEQVSEKL